MSDPLAEIRDSFFVECEELLESLQDGLQAIDDGLSDDETVNMVFRSVHSIKGGAGAFGLDALVDFAHTFETALDEVRAGRLPPEGEVLKLFFKGSDILADLVRDYRDGRPPAEETYAPTLADLAGLAPPTEANQDAEAGIDFEPAPISLDLTLGPADDEPDLAGFSPADFGPDERDAAAGGSAPPTAAEPSWNIRFKPNAALYAHGNEPLFLFRALGSLGPLDVRCLENDLPPLDELDPEQSFIGWELTLQSREPEAALREVFDFVEGLCLLDIEMVDGPTPGPAAFDPAERALLTKGTGHDSGQDELADAAPQLADLATPSVALPVAPRPQAEQTEPSPPEPTAPAAPRPTVRVDLERIDRLVNLVGEIVVNQAVLTQSVEAAGLPANSPVRTGLEEFLQLTRDLQESVMMIRAQPVKSLFQRMNRILREASASVGKQVHLKVEGEHTEVDKTVIERLADPLTHMIRNAVDHGLETGEDRVAAGKPREGQVTLSAMHRSGRIVIAIADDGAGIDRAKVLEKAIANGLVAADSQLCDAEIDALLFAPGLSTASSVSNLSGRGVGMDVVRSAIQALGGRITITSEPGQGSTFSISLPLTLAVLDGMVVRVAGETLIVPLNTILETLALADDDIRALGPDTRVVNIRDQFVPLFDLGAELGYRNPPESYAGAVVLLIGQDDGPTAAIAVDAIEDQRQVVIKGLQDSYGRIPGIAAATILGDGQIALILDPLDLVTLATRRHRATATATTDTEPAMEVLA